MKNQYIGRDCLKKGGVAWTDHRFKEDWVVSLNVRSWCPNAHYDYFAPFRIIKNRFTKINEMGNGKYGLFLTQKVYWKMIFTDYCKGLVLNFLVMENKVFFTAKKLMERWYLHCLFEVLMIFQNLQNMVFLTVIKKVCSVKIVNLTILCKQYFACSV